MATRRPIDDAVLKFYGAMVGLTVALFGILALWLGLTDATEPPYFNVALTSTWVISLILTALVLEYARRRPAGAHLSWGEAMLGSAYVFFLLFWIYGVVPHQFLTFADSELNWRSDRLLAGPTMPDAIARDQGFVEWVLPFDLTYEVVRDIMVVGIYGLGLAGNIALWSVWQNRGKEAEPTEVETSTYGRPLVREGVNA